jgi:hypothetical protein
MRARIACLVLCVAGCAGDPIPLGSNGGYPLTCSNGVRDGHETDVDCGGGACAPCTAGKMCSAGSDCVSGDCTNGACGAGCVDGAACTVANGTGTCAHNACSAVTCTHGFADCNGNAADGCEVDLATDAANCGACGVACPSGQACANGACAGPHACNQLCIMAPNAVVGFDAQCNCVITHCLNGYGDCDHLLANGCETNLASDAANCGLCGNVCPHGESCLHGACAGPQALGTACTSDHQCASGFCASGVCCDTACGGACQACNLAGSLGTCTPLPAGAPGTPACAPLVCDGTHGVCVAPSSCTDGVKDGHETDVDCGGPDCAPCTLGKACLISCDCDVASSYDCANGICVAVAHAFFGCPVPNGYGQCVHDQCGGTITCMPGFADCDLNATNGCETEVDKDPLNCGACGVVCPSGACNLGVCVATACLTASDCPAGEVCVNGACVGCACSPPNATGACDASGACTIGSCNPGFGNCNGHITDGCEANLATDPNNCGACANVCPTGDACVNGACVSTGCSITCNLQNATSTCANGACQIVQCNSGYADCDFNAANGCEVNVTSDPHNCGACGVGCLAGHLCVHGACQ